MALHALCESPLGALFESPLGVLDCPGGGTMLFAAGRGAAGGQTATNEFNHVTETWGFLQAALLAPVRTKGAGQPLRGPGKYVLAAGFNFTGHPGFAGHLLLTDRLDIAGQAWTRGANMPRSRDPARRNFDRRSHCVGEDMGGELFATGGDPFNIGSTFGTRDNDSYSPALDRWTRRAEISGVFGRYDHCMRGNKRDEFYVYGGIARTDALWLRPDIYAWDLLGVSELLGPAIFGHDSAARYRSAGDSYTIAPTMPVQAPQNDPGTGDTLHAQPMYFVGNHNEPRTHGRANGIDLGAFILRTAGAAWQFMQTQNFGGSFRFAATLADDRVLLFGGSREQRGQIPGDTTPGSEDGPLPNNGGLSFWNLTDEIFTWETQTYARAPNDRLDGIGDMIQAGGSTA